MCFDCKHCIHGLYNFLDSCWEEGCGAVDELDCERMFEPRR